MIIGEALSAELMRLLADHKPKANDYIQIRITNPAPTPYFHTSIFINEKDAIVFVSLVTVVSMMHMVLSSFTIQFADPRCIEKVVEIINCKKLQELFVNEYNGTEYGVGPRDAFGDLEYSELPEERQNYLMKMAIRKWMNEKGIADANLSADYIEFKLSSN